MEPSKFDRIIRDSLNDRPHNEGQEAQERVWKAVERQLEQRPSRMSWKIAALILLLMVPSYVLFMQNRRQAAIIRKLNRTYAMVPKPEIVRDTVIVQQPVITRIQTDTVRKIQIIKDTVVVYQPVEMAVAPPHDTEVAASGYQPAAFNPGVSQESQRAEFLLEPDHQSHRNRKKTGRTFSFRFSLGTASDGSESPAGIQARL
jgi:hypothetical protein